LAWLEAALGPPLESADGELRFEVGLRRRPGAKPALSGELQMANGALDFGEALALSGIEGVFTFADDVVTVQSLAASTGGGRVTVTGTVGLDAGPNLKWRLNEVALAPMQALEVELRGSGHLRGAWDAVELGGDVKVVQLLYDRDLEFADLIPSFNRALRPARKRQAGRPPLRLDLHITATQSLFVENNIARLEAGADLHLRGTLRKPTLQGDVRIVDGVIRLRKREFEVLNGSLTFRPALGNVAAIDFKAESVVDTDEESYGVGIRVSGLTNDYRVRLTSTDGGLSQTDVASLITFGKTVSQLQRGGGEGGGVSLDTLVGLAGYNLGGRLADQAEEVLPFDQIEFRPQFSTTTGQFEPEVRVGKNLSEDLSAWIGQTFGVQSRTTVEAEYRLSARLASALLWESSTASEQGAIGGEARFRRDFWRFGQILFFGAGD
jgi:autotransporter translocation and assembly factor TamB